MLGSKPTPLIEVTLLVLYPGMSNQIVFEIDNQENITLIRIKFRLANVRNV